MAYWRNLSSVLSGTVIAQILPVLGSLVLARQYSPGEFGAYAVWLGITIFSSVCLTARFEASLPMEEDGQNRKLAVLYVIATVLIFSVLPLLTLASLFLMDIKNIGPMSLALLLLSFLVSVMTSLAQTWQAWAVAEGFYKKLSLIRITQSGLVVVFQVGIGLVQPNVMGLILGHFIGFLLNLVICILLMPINTSFDITNFKFGLLAFWKK